MYADTKLQAICCYSCDMLSFRFWIERNQMSPNKRGSNKKTRQADPDRKSGCRRRSPKLTRIKGTHIPNGTVDVEARSYKLPADPWVCWFYLVTASTII